MTTGQSATAAPQSQAVVQQPQTHKLSAGVRKTIQSIKEIVGCFSDADIYLVLKETDMDPNETAQKLLNQAPFHEVKKKRDKKKEIRESMSYNRAIKDSNHAENFSLGMKVGPSSLDRAARRVAYNQSTVPGNEGMSHEFRDMRYNRNNTFVRAESKSTMLHDSTPNKQGTTFYNENRLARRPPGPWYASRVSRRVPSQQRQTRDDGPCVLNEKSVSEPKQASPANVLACDSRHHSPIPASANRDVGLYSSATDPVHVPPSNSRSSVTIGTIRREVGVVGGHRQFSENGVKDSSSSSSSKPTTSTIGMNPSLPDSFPQFPAMSNAAPLGPTSEDKSIRPVASSGIVASQPKAPQHSKEWKPKSSQRSVVSSSKVVGAPEVHGSPTISSEKMELDASNLAEKLAQANIFQNENVIIAQHIKVPEDERCQLTFGSFGLELDSSWNFTSKFNDIRVSEESNGLTIESAHADGSNHAELRDDQAQASGSNSPASGIAYELAEKSPSPSSNNFATLGLIKESIPSHTCSEMQPQSAPELQNLSAYIPQNGYDMSYLRPQISIDESLRGRSLPLSQEALNLHAVSSIPVSTLSMVQQPQPMPQMYPQVHVSHFGNLMPYRQFLSPVYVPQIAVPGYSGNPSFTHPSNGSNYLLMHGNGSHVGASSLKYGIQQFKPVPGSSPNGFGNFSGPSAYALNPSGLVSNASGLDDSSRMKYKDGNLYVSNPQLTDPSEIWIQNPRDLQAGQSASYYNVQAQAHPHPHAAAAAAYLPSHPPPHASFNATPPQSSHVHQFSGLYPPPAPQPAPIPNQHPLAPVVAANPAAPGSQLATYPPPQLGHLNWSTSF